MIARNGSRRRVLDVFVVSVLAAAPFAPYLLFALREGVPRFSLAGDFALLEQATRHVWRGDALLGPYSRFHWHHPGPLFFYLVAPVEALFGPASTGLFVGTCAVNAVAATTLVALLRVTTTPPPAVAGLVVVLLWFAAFGNVAATPWNPLVIVLPLMTFLVACALCAKGERRAIVPTVLFGALAISTHVAVVPTVAASAVTSAILYATSTRTSDRRSGGMRRRTSRRSDRRRFAVSALIVLFAFLPPFVEQLTAPRGNGRALLEFFVLRDAPGKPLATALRNSVLAVAWMPERLVERALPAEGWIPHGMRWDAMPAELNVTAATIAVAHVLLAIAASFIALRRRDTTSLAVLGFGVLGELVALTSLRAIVGDDLHYLVFWTTAASSVTWMGILSALFSTASSAVARCANVRRYARAALVIGGIGFGTTVTFFQHRWLSRNRALPGSYPGMRAPLGALHAALRDRLARDGATPVIHLDGAYDLAQAMVLELEKDAIDVRVPDADRWTFTGIRGDANVSRPVHVWFSQPALVLEETACMERLAEQGGLAVYVSDGEPSCSARPDTR